MTDEANEYVLGTHDAELERLGLQHDVWRDHMRAGWRRAGLETGMRVIDAGAGPGYATAELAEVVGPTGAVLAVERSGRFADAIRRRSERAAHDNVTVVEGDLMHLVPPAGYDAAWCRWVASFVPDVGALARWLAAALRPGGRLVMHEYADYGSWRVLPERPALAEFVGRVMSAWRADGGEPDIAPTLVELLGTCGFREISVKPLQFTARPGDPMWRWPAAFVRVNCERLVATRRADAAWATAVIGALVEAERDRGSAMTTPLVWEIIAERSG